MMMCYPLVLLSLFLGPQVRSNAMLNRTTMSKPHDCFESSCAGCRPAYLLGSPGTPKGAMKESQTGMTYHPVQGLATAMLTA